MSDDALNIDRIALEQLAALLLERAGLRITPDGYYGLRLALLARMPALGLSDAQEYVRRLRQLAGEHELRALLPLVTVGKTEFFRDTRQFAAYTNEIFPRALARARSELRKVHLWSAGCATGEEPYSMAMVALEKGALPEEVDLWATDLNPVAVQRAAEGTFSVRRMVGVTEERLNRYFVSAPDGYQASSFLRGLVRFEGHNLAAPVWPQVQPQSLDVILCRNVIIYFDPPTIVATMERFYESLRPGGWLLLGYSESLFKFPNRFDMVEVGGVFLYRRPPSGEPRPARDSLTAIRQGGMPTLSPPPFNMPRAVPAPLPVGVRQPTPLPMTPLPPVGVRRPTPLPIPSAPRPLVEKPPSGAFSALVPAARRPAERLAAVTALVEQGDFPRALRAAHLLVEELPEDLAARLTLGNVHALMGATDEAREAFTEALQREPLSVDAHLFLAIAALQAGQFDEARTELTRALFLEPTMALGNYLLGQVLEKRKDPEGARRAYRNAMAQRKAPPRELLAHFPDLPRSNEAIAQAAQFRLAALSEV